MQLIFIVEENKGLLPENGNYRDQILIKTTITIKKGSHCG